MLFWIWSLLLRAQCRISRKSGYNRKGIGSMKPFITPPKTSVNVETSHVADSSGPSPKGTETIGDVESRGTTQTMQELYHLGGQVNMMRKMEEVKMVKGQVAKLTDAPRNESTNIYTPAKSDDTYRRTQASSPESTVNRRNGRSSLVRGSCGRKRSESTGWSRSIWTTSCQWIKPVVEVSVDMC